MRVVIAGFGPFPGAPSNPSGHLATALARRRRPALAGVEITSHVFATAYNAVDRDLPKLLARKPDVILIFGLAGRRRDVCVETRARNARSILFPDVSGWRPKRAVIEPGQRALTGNAPFPRLLNALRQTALPARLSRDAGAYLCNYAYWRALRHVRDGRPLVQFVHIPWVSSTPRRASSLRSAPPLSRLVVAGENLLIALVAASRRLNPPPIAARPLSGSARPQNHSSCASVGSTKRESAARSLALSGKNRAMTAAMIACAARLAPSSHLMAMPKPLLRQRGAIDAFGAGFHEHAFAEQLHHVGAEAAGAGDVPRRFCASVAKPRRSPRAFGRNTAAGAEFGKAVREIMQWHRPGRHRTAVDRAAASPKCGAGKILKHAPN